jgi:putative peptide zinc metalloprotease protein
MLKLLREDTTSSFSDLWYRLGPTRPRLSPHARVARQRFGGETAYIVEDPASGNYYRLSDSAYFFIGLLDGRRTVDGAWEACNSKLGDDAPTQRECVELLSRLQLYGCLSGDLPLAADMVELRRREAKSRKLQRRTGRGVSMTIPLVNPEPWLERSRHLLRAVFSNWGAAAWTLVVLFALYRIILKREALTDGLNGVLDPSNLVWLGAVFVVLRAWHELGHAAACKAMGARCTEIGLMLIALVLPFPYCDTSAAWRLQEVWKRVIVSAGGMIFETFVAALAAIAWSFMGKDDSGILRAILYNTMIVSGVTTLVFNLNPLLRYDGYYMLSDAAGSANLAQRAQELLKFFAQRYLFRLASSKPPAVRSIGELWLLIVYGVLSFPYRIMVVSTIVLVLWSSPKYLTIGAVIAVVAGVSWILWPILKGIGYLLTSPQLLGRRARSIAMVGGTALVMAILIGLMPMPAGGYAIGTIEPKVAESIRPSEDGFVKTVHVRPGDFVNVGDPIVTLYNAEVTGNLATAEAQVEGARAEVDAAIGGPMPARVQAETHLRQLEGNLARARERSESLVLRARVSGQMVPAAGAGTQLDRLTGQFVQKGTMLGTVATTDQLIVRCVVADRDHGYIFRGKIGDEVNGVGASVRVRGRAWDKVEGQVLRDTPAGSRKVAGEALTTAAGGDVLVDPADPKKETTVAPQWVVEVGPQDITKEQIEAWKPGLRARVRFSAAPEPLLQQWWRDLRQYLDDKAEV